MSRHRTVVVAATVAWAFALGAWCQTPVQDLVGQLRGGGETPTATIMMPMTDGTELATDYYLPKEGGPPWPVVLARSAYPRGIAMRRARRFVNNGYACVMQDIRGLGHSKGERNVWYADGWREGLQDGRDTVAWIKAQPWCNGKVATYGGSALGITQVLMAPATPGLACQIIEVAPSNFYYNLAYQGGVWRRNLADGWLTFLRLGDTGAMYKSHPCYDEFWTYYNADDKATQVTAPAVHVGGWYDIFQQGTINNFVTRQHHGGPGAKGNQKLIMRWNTHTGDCPPEFSRKRMGAGPSVSRHSMRFLDYWLKGEENGIIDEPAVHYFVIGDDTDADAPGMVWRTANDWPPFPTTETSYFLAPQGRMQTEPTTEAATAAFTYDPADPFPTLGGANLLRPAGPFDQRPAREGRDDYVLFLSEPLEETLEATGRIWADLYVSTDAPDTDFTAKLLDVYPAGDDREILMLDGIRRVKTRNGFEQTAPLLTSNELVVKVHIDLWSISWIFNTGHRIGVQISSSNYPRFEKNPNTGEDFPTGDLRVAHNNIHMSPDHPSALVLPVRK